MVCAVEIEVTTNLDSGPGSLREAVAMAADGDTVSFADALDGQPIILTSGELVIDGKSIVFDGSVSRSNIVLKTDGSSRIFRLRDSNSTFGTFRFENAASAIDGAAVSISGGSPSFTFCFFANCVGRNGGAVSNEETVVTFNSCRFNGNDAQGLGGAIYSRKSTVNIQFGRAEGNHASSGGALYSDDCDGTIDQITFSGNNADGNGGAVYGNLSRGTMSGCLVQDNRSEFGGAVYDTNSNAVYEVCSFLGNSGDEQGGSVFFQSTESEINRCLFKGCTAREGGGALTYDESSGALTNCIFQSNVSEDLGGALFLRESSPAISNCTFQGNRADKEGGALFLEKSNPQISNTIVWNNLEDFERGELGSSLTLNGNEPVITTSLFENWRASELGNESNLDGTERANAPRFITPLSPARAPQLTGGDLRLSEGSPLIDRGSEGVFFTGGDYFDNPRIVGVSDLGAFEFQGPIYVNAAVVGGDKDGSSWENAYANLKRALSIGDDGRRLYVAEGSYNPDENGITNSDDRGAFFSPERQQLVFGGFPSSGNPSFDERDSRVFPTILSGDIDQNDDTGDHSGNAINVLQIFSSTSYNHLHGLVIRGGNANDRDNFKVEGGGLRALFGRSLSITDCVFENNRAVGPGGAITITSLSAYFERCLFRGNSSGGSGGAIQESRGNGFYLNCVFTGNAAGSIGGAVNIQNNQLEMVNCTLQGNRSASRGGAISAVTTGTLTLSNCLIWNNLSEGSRTQQASSFRPIDTNANRYQHNLIQNWSTADLGNSGNLDGTDSSADPLFIAPINPSSAPTSRGADLGLAEDSPALDEGDNDLNDSALDILGQPRRSGRIDLGAYEGEVEQLARLWFSDFDRDGASLGVELALGTNPEKPDATSIRRLRIFSFPEDGSIVLNFGKGEAAPEGTVWRLLRSETLEGQFMEVYRFDETTGEVIVPGFQSFLTSSNFTISKPEGVAPKAFYRYEAVYLPEGVE